MADELRQELLARHAPTYMDDLSPNMKDLLQTIFMSLRGKQADSQKIPELPPSPAGFQPDPPMVMSPKNARLTKTILDLDPYIKRGVKSIVQGPTSGSMSFMQWKKEPVDTFPMSRLLGVQNPADRSIGINPDIPSGYEVVSPSIRSKGMGFLNTLIHELTHAAGYNNEETPNNVERLLQELAERELK